MTPRVVPILGSVRWDPNAPEERFAQDEDGFAALVLRSHPDDSDASSVVIFWSGVQQASFGPPNDEGRHLHPLYGAGLDTLLWAGEVIDADSDRSPTRHFIVPTKEGLAEIQARQINWARLRGVSDAKTAIARLKPIPEAPRRYPEAAVEGFTIGMYVSYGDCGDAWVAAPDGGIATLIWATAPTPTFREEIPADPAGRWGTYAVALDLPMTNDEEAASYLRAVLPELIPRWKAWAQSR